MNDTAPDMLTKQQVEAYRRMSPTEKWRQSKALYFAARERKRAFLKQQYPDWSDEDIERKLRRFFSMREADPALVFLRPLNRAKIRYMVTGSFAASVYGEPRMTHDIDIVLLLPRGDEKRLSDLFPDPEFYCPPEEVIGIELSREAHGHSNLIHHQTGFKAVLYFVGKDSLHRWAMSNRRTVEVEGEPVQLAPPEYVIVRKLEFHREGQSQKHLRDVEGMLGCLQELDRSIIGQFCDERGLQSQWQSVQGH
jgi:hypothetical protein